MRAPRRRIAGPVLLGCLAALVTRADGFAPARGSLCRPRRTAPVVSTGDAPPGGSDAIYAGLRARCEQLQAAAARELTDLADLRHAWVVLFRGDETGDGIHSLSSEGREIVLAFEAGAEAQRFALVLKAQGFYEPTPRKMDVRDLEAFCASDERISLLRVPEGALERDALQPLKHRLLIVVMAPAPRGAATRAAETSRWSALCGLVPLSSAFGSPHSR